MAIGGLSGIVPPVESGGPNMEDTAGAFQQSIEGALRDAAERAGIERPVGEPFRPTIPGAIESNPRTDGVVPEKPMGVEPVDVGEPGGVEPAGGPGAAESAPPPVR